ncbi:hypothetical protein DP923_10020 [Pontibacter arcticus]|uniref:Uncharacterized protein n=1 Tax=Pontibacter arcticus TaxID=2080288 RepID=A0A364RCZ6_9BACT|nr:hypothetical protein DP923_10020 [Pontibacter arcticus]
MPEGYEVVATKVGSLLLWITTSYAALNQRQTKYTLPEVCMCKCPALLLFILKLILPLCLLSLKP